MCKVGIIDIEPQIFNTAYMQISQYHKQKGDTVNWWSPLTDQQFDIVYCSSLFEFTDKREVPKRAICGGTGFDITSLLSKNMEACNYDYSLYPECDYSIVWFSRGCIRNCPFCVVRQKEGYINPVKPKQLNHKREYIAIQDNNFFASPDWREAHKQLLEWGLPVSFSGGIDIRLITKEQCDALNSLKIHKQIYIAWDNPKQDLREHIKLLVDNVKPYKIACYVLIGYWSTPEEDLYRVEELRKFKIDPFAMPYNKKDPYQRAFARYVNHKATFKIVKWEDYRG